MRRDRKVTISDGTSDRLLGRPFPMSIFTSSDGFQTSLSQDKEYAITSNMKTIANGPKDKSSCPQRVRLRIRIRFERLIIPTAPRKRWCFRARQRTPARVRSSRNYRVTALVEGQRRFPEQLLLRLEEAEQRDFGAGRKGTSHHCPSQKTRSPPVIAAAKRG